jgi:hypothetical protein
MSRVSCLAVTLPQPRAALLKICTFVMLLSAAAANAAALTLTGDVVDYGASTPLERYSPPFPQPPPRPRVCCADIAAVNLLAYLDRQSGLGGVLPPGDFAPLDIGEQQEEFHRTYDPTFSTVGATDAEIRNGLESLLRRRGFTSDVKLFEQRQLSYATLLQEWKENELILLTLDSVPSGVGHTVFLWGLEDDPSNPRLAIADSIVHPNTDHRRHQDNARPTTLNGQAYDGRGTITWVNVNIGTEGGLPNWTIQLTNPYSLYEYEEPFNTFKGEEFEEHTFTWQIEAFISVSDVRPASRAAGEPSVAILLSAGLIVLICFSGTARRKQL